MNVLFNRKFILFLFYYFDFLEMVDNLISDLKK